VDQNPRARRQRGGVERLRRRERDKRQRRGLRVSFRKWSAIKGWFVGWLVGCLLACFPE
jgi:hypothetical protein